MAAGGYFTLAVLVMALVPVVVTSLEGQKAPEWLYPVIAVFGLMSSALHGGLQAMLWSLAAACVVLLLIGGAVTMLRATTRLRILTGGQIKLMAAGATWLGPLGALIMIAAALFVLFAIAALQQVGDAQRRPNSAIIVALAILGVALQQQLVLS